MCLLILPVSFFAGFSNLVVGRLKKFSLWSFKVFFIMDMKSEVYFLTYKRHLVRFDMKVSSLSQIRMEYLENCYISKKISKVIGNNVVLNAPLGWTSKQEFLKISFFDLYFLNLI